MVLLLQSITGALHKLNVTNELTVEELERYCSDVFLQTDVNKDEKVRCWQCMVFRRRHRSRASRAAAQITFDEFSQWALMSVKSQELIHSFKSTHASMVSSASSQDMSAKQTPRRPKTTGKKRRNGRGKSSDHRRPRSSAGGKQDSSSRDDGSAKARSRHRGGHSTRSHGSPAAGGLPSLSAGSGGGYYSDDEEKLARAQKAKAQRIRDSASRGRSSGGLGATRPTRENVDVDVVAPTRRSRSQGPKRRERSAANNRRSKSKDAGDKQPSGGTPVKKRARRKEKTPKRPETPDYAAQGLQKQMMRTRAAKLHTIATRELLRELVDVTAFSFSELNELVHHFTDVSDVRGVHLPSTVTPLISLVVRVRRLLVRCASVCLKISLRSTCPACSKPTCLASCIDSWMLTPPEPFPSQSSAWVSLWSCVAQWTKSCASCSKSMTMTVRVRMSRAPTEDAQLVLTVTVFCWAIADSGVMEVMELMQLIEHGNQELAEVTEFAADVMKSLDNDGDGEISRCVGRLNDHVERDITMLLAE